MTTQQNTSTLNKANITALQLSFGGDSRKGIKDENQDAFAVSYPTHSVLSAKGAIATLADGVSSASHAAKAAQLAVTQLIQDYYATPETWSTEKSVSKVLTSLNQWLFSQSDNIDLHDNSMRNQQWFTTLSSLIIKSTTGYIFHIGDTRISRLRANQFEIITQDHNRKQGNQSNILTRALGADSRLRVDYHKIDVQNDDIFIISCDGVHDFVDKKTITQMLTTLTEKPTNQELEAASRAITDTAINNGSDDNVSCLLVHVAQTPNRQLSEIERDIRERAIPPVMEPGMKIDNYIIGKAIHSSTRSHLYLVENILDKQTSVLKVPSLNFSDDSLYLQGFMRESWVGERINHPNIMKVTSDCHDSRFLYHICEYIDGQTLSEWMHDNPSPSIAQVRDIITQVISALRAFQRLELVHRDIKPDNIMIDKYGQIKLIDYGTVSIASLDEDINSIKDDVPQGTLNYIAPETLLSMQSSNMSDLFSLGVICYEMLTGELPFKPMNRAEVTQTGFQDWQYRSIKQFRHDIPFWLDLCLKQCTEPDPSLRYQAFSEFQKDLTKPNLSAIEEYKKQPILQRDPIKFWQGMSVILFVLLIISLTN
ncbi:bifunctional protein-serine/threonine kinase/phosphatase [Thalassotalea sp. SU-HH00458]|uniref:bifunctional protein-serine/threonine kinase/phosphatase n=1 Tax=Thalassotalea sp. SU-HH00458 TaxID=3127657 RepID=UPI00310B11AF